jgi:heme exporter protein A
VIQKLMEEQGHVSSVWSLTARDLTKSFGGAPVLRGINLSLRYGESVVIFGPNGAGKTTLLKVLATIMKPSSGEIVVDGLNLKNDAEEIRRRVGVVTHQTLLYGNLTAYENLRFYSRMYDVHGARERIEEVVAMVGMTSRLHSRVDTLSRGMQQRLSIARALLHKPVIILLDEAETGLDQEALSMLWRALRSDGERKRSIVFTTHNLERGLELSDRLLILDNGKFVYEGSKEVLDMTRLKEIYQHNTRMKV